MTRDWADFGSLPRRWTRGFRGPFVPVSNANFQHPVQFDNPWVTTQNHGGLALKAFGAGQAK